MLYPENSHESNNQTCTIQRTFIQIKAELPKLSSHYAVPQSKKKLQQYQSVNNDTFINIILQQNPSNSSIDLPEFSGKEKE